MTTRIGKMKDNIPLAIFFGVLALLVPWVNVILPTGVMMPLLMRFILLVVFSCLVAECMDRGIVLPGDDWGLGVFVGSAGLYLVVGLICMLNFVDNFWHQNDSFPLETRTVQVDEQEIHSLHGAEVASGGSFVIGFGRIHNEIIYTATRQTEDGGYKFFTIQGDVTLYENLEAGETARLEIHEIQKRRIRPKVPMWVQTTFGIAPEGAWEDAGTEQRIIVPEGTVRQRHET